jgi:hypothetical protein
MQAVVLEALRARRAEIRARWSELLRVEPVNTPLAHPDALAHLIDWTLDEIFRAILLAAPRRRHSAVSAARPDCPCGRNPLLVYFDIAGQALREALIFAQAALPHLDPVERDAALYELNAALRHVAHREIETFCGVCQYRRAAADSTSGHPAMSAHPADARPRPTHSPPPRTASCAAPLHFVP